MAGMPVDVCDIGAFVAFAVEKMENGIRTAFGCVYADSDGVRPTISDRTDTAGQYLGMDFCLGVAYGDALLYRCTFSAKRQCIAWIGGGTVFIGGSGAVPVFV